MKVCWKHVELSFARRIRWLNQTALLQVQQCTVSSFLRKAHCVCLCFSYRHPIIQVPLHSYTISLLDLITAFMPWFGLWRSCSSRTMLSWLCFCNNLRANTPHNPFLTFLGKLRHYRPARPVAVEIHQLETLVWCYSFTLCVPFFKQSRLQRAIGHRVILGHLRYSFLKVSSQHL